MVGSCICGGIPACGVGSTEHGIGGYDMAKRERRELNESATVRLDGSGNGTAKVGPLSARETWYPATVSVSVTAPVVNESQCQIFIGDVNTKRFRDSTESGSTGDNTAKVGADKLKVNEYVWAVWTGGDALQYAVVTVTGEKEV